MTIEDLIKTLSSHVNTGGGSIDEAYKHVAKLIGANPDAQDLLKQAVREYQKRIGAIRDFRDPPSIEAGNLEEWYAGPRDDDRYWQKLKVYLREDWDDIAVQSVDDASTRIISLLQPPGRPKINTRGLVVGYVQSGKTSNFTAVIAKAADVSYKFFIVLSGITNALRGQTQRRLEAELVHLNPDHWVTLTTPTDDFHPGPAGNVRVFLSEHQNLRVLCVVKKNATVLNRLLRWLRGATPELLATCPILIIDDEADQASVNSSRDSANKRTTINQRLVDLLQLLPKAGYIGYTATPFANVFIDPSVPEDLYPRDFIVALPKPDKYFGAERIFGRDRLWNEGQGQAQDRPDMIRFVEQTEVPNLQPGLRDKDQFEPELTASIEKALRYFWMACAARYVRNQSNKHMSMLIHTSVYTIVHDRVRNMIEAYKSRFLKRVKVSDPTLYADLEDQWVDEQKRVSAQSMGGTPISFAEVKGYLAEVTERTNIVVDNYRSQQRLSYEGDAAIQIAVGGDTLARGLTLEGLTVSYFIRSASAYDTLLQMGRWFGFREGYADLTRMWMTRELEKWFYDLATIEEEMRQDILKFRDEGITPLDFAVRIRTHPSLDITAAAKMQNAVMAYVSYNDKLAQTVLFKNRDTSWLKGNLSATQQLVSRLAQQGHLSRVGRSRQYIYTSVPSTNITGFLKQYRTHEEARTSQSYLWREYIEKQNSRNQLTKWNIVFSNGNESATVNLGSDIVLHTTLRSKMQDDNDFADIRSLPSGSDQNLDEAIPPEKAGKLTGKKLRDLRPSTVGLMIVYVIDKDSIPAVEDEKREALNAVEHVIGIALVFPDLGGEIVTVQYMSADLSRVQRETPEWDMDEGEEE